VSGIAWRKRLPEVVLGLLVLVSALAAVYAKHESRRLFTELQALTAERDRLAVEWGQLQIEQSAWSTHARVEQLAREEMNMRDPAADQILLFSK
jgi:cell division protein FtsL